MRASRVWVSRWMRRMRKPRSPARVNSPRKTLTIASTMKTFQAKCVLLPASANFFSFWTRSRRHLLVSFIENDFFSSLVVAFTKAFLWSVVNSDESEWVREKEKTFWVLLHHPQTRRVDLVLWRGNVWLDSDSPGWSFSSRDLESLHFKSALERAEFFPPAWCLMPFDNDVVIKSALDTQQVILCVSSPHMAACDLFGDKCNWLCGLCQASAHGAERLWASSRRKFIEKTNVGGSFLSNLTRLLSGFALIKQKNHLTSLILDQTAGDANNLCAQTASDKRPKSKFQFRSHSRASRELLSVFNAQQIIPLL